MTESKTTLKMVWTIGALFFLVNLCFSLQNAFVNITWEDLSGFKRIQLFIGVTGSLASIMMAYLSKTFAKLDPSVAAIINGNATDYQLKSVEQETLAVKATDNKPAASVVKTIESTVTQEVVPQPPISAIKKP